MKRDDQNEDVEVEAAAPGEQLELIDVAPENAKKIKPLARKYKAAMKTRVEASGVEVAAKDKLLTAIKEEKLTPLADGTLRLRCDGMTITVTPRDELVRVKDAAED